MVKPGSHVSVSVPSVPTVPKQPWRGHEGRFLWDGTGILPLQASQLSAPSEDLTARWSPVGHRRTSRCSDRSSFFIVRIVRRTVVQ